MGGASKTELKLLAFMASRPASDFYGLEIARGVSLPASKVYPALAKFEANGWIEAEWESVDPHEAGRKPRRYYRLTDSGRAYAKEQLNDVLGPLAPALNLPTLAQLLAWG